MVIFLTSSKPGDFISLEDLVDCQKQWLEMRKGQSQDSKTGERRALGWEGISTHAENAKGGSRIWLLETIVLEQSGQKETCREKLNDLGMFNIIVGPIAGDRLADLSGWDRSLNPVV